ncbi:aldehyde dehydrogenase [Vibrio neptunius]|nr:aldehyde dehydrogenase [Vibrio neptunius]
MAILSKNNQDRVDLFSDLPTGQFIAGREVPPSSGEYIDVEDPGSELVFAQCARGNVQDVEAAVESSKKGFKVWRATPPAERAKMMFKLADALESHIDTLAVIEAMDSGKPLNEAHGDVINSADQLRYYGGLADKFAGDTVPLGDSFVSFNAKEPVGVTVHVAPWNFPLLTAIRGVAPSLAAGCSAIVKPSEITPLSSLLMAKIFSEAGLPDGVVNVVNGYGSEIGNALTSHKDVRHVTFTGSVATGQNVMRSAANNISSVTLELGGKSPAIALSDADVELVADDMMWAIFFNSGQVCSAGSRLIIHRDIHEEFMGKFLSNIEKIDFGHALEDKRLASITSKAHLDKIQGMVDAAKERGLTIRCGGSSRVHPLTDKGYYFEPTVIDDVPMDDDIVQKEIFGPVLAIQIIDSDDDGVDAANCTDFGLAACVYSKDTSKALAMAGQIDAGQVTINQYYAGGFYTPFGGTKMSGFGREKGLASIENYLRVKNITLKI